MERMDRRGDAQPRPLTLIPNFVETADGSCLITAGKTRVICTASVEEGVPPSACKTSQSSVMVRSPKRRMSTACRSDRPISR